MIISRTQLAKIMQLQGTATENEYDRRTQTNRPTGGSSCRCCVGLTADLVDVDDVSSCCVALWLVLNSQSLHQKHFDNCIHCLFSEVCEAVIVRRPQDTVGFIGDTAVLKCGTNDSQLSLKWTVGVLSGTVASSSTGVSANYRPRLSLNRSAEGQFDLVFNYTQSEDNGTYTCYPRFVRGVQAELILLGKSFT